MIPKGIERLELQFPLKEMLLFGIFSSRFCIIKTLLMFDGQVIMWSSIYKTADLNIFLTIMIFKALQTNFIKARKKNLVNGVFGLC